MNKFEWYWGQSVIDKNSYYGFFLNDRFYGLVEYNTLGKYKKSWWII